jgi:hypothetical protein
MINTLGFTHIEVVTLNLYLTFLEYYGGYNRKILK